MMTQTPIHTAFDESQTWREGREPFCPLQINLARMIPAFTKNARRFRRGTDFYINSLITVGSATPPDETPTQFGTGLRKEEVGGPWRATASLQRRNCDMHNQRKFAVMETEAISP